MTYVNIHFLFEKLSEHRRLTEEIGPIVRAIFYQQAIAAFWRKVLRYCRTGFSQKKTKLVTISRHSCSIGMRHFEIAKNLFFSVVRIVQVPPNIAYRFIEDKTR